MLFFLFVFSLFPLSLPPLNPSFFLPLLLCLPSALFPFSPSRLFRFSLRFFFSFLFPLTLLRSFLFLLPFFPSLLYIYLHSLSSSFHLSFPSPSSLYLSCSSPRIIRFRCISTLPFSLPVSPSPFLLFPSSFSPHFPPLALARARTTSVNNLAGAADGQVVCLIFFFFSLPFFLLLFSFYPPSSLYFWGRVYLARRKRRLWFL